MKILIIDDDQELTSLLKMQIEDTGNEADVANDGKYGESLAMKNYYDVIVIDLMLPGTDGHTIVKNIRDKGITAPILMISSLDSDDERRTGYKIGVDHYMAKPFNFEDFYEKILKLEKEGH